MHRNYYSNPRDRINFDLTCQRTSDIQTYQYSSIEAYAIDMLIALGSDLTEWPPNRYLWEFFPARRDFNRDLSYLAYLAGQASLVTFDQDIISRYCESHDFMNDESFLQYNW